MSSCKVGALLPGDPTPQPSSAVRVPLTVRVVPTPPRARRVLFDNFHSLRYPSAYLPRDNLQATWRPLASGAWGCSLGCTGLQPLVSGARGCSL